MVRRLLQCLDQVVSVLWVYGPEGAFAYALKEAEEQERGEKERDVTGNVTASFTSIHGAQTPQHKAQSRRARWRQHWEERPPSLPPSFPLCRKRRARLSPPAEGGLSNSSHSTGDGVCIFRSKQHLMKPWAPAPQEPAYR